ncbi:plastocyanin/azurin family copper-binding protein [Paenibacillus silvisoli]|uniref:plastocyanin/azurin family copper-binding protein n=1 Tax=Paenibacillus silvisoli TaxID=3110539 RepID=UPI0028047644|nr:plastocyanin/azurin family copper-binding protein [Paenibacillus silvisoli]
MKKIRIIILALILAATMGMTGVNAADNAAAPQSWDVSVGLKMSADTEMFSMQPGVTYIHEGDTVTFTNKDMLAPHTVTFLAGGPPLTDPNRPADPSGSQWDGTKPLDSGQMMPGMTYVVTFTKSGAYPFYCQIHPSMKGTIVVVPKGQLIPTKVEQIAAQKEHLDEAMHLAHTLREHANEPHYTVDGKGAITYQVSASISTHELMVNAFLPGELYINAGDSVEWTNTAMEVHLATINVPKDMEVLTAEGFNPAIIAQTKNTQFDGKGMITSGFLGMMEPADLIHPSFRVTFTKPGTYTVTDPLWNFSGTIVVAPKGAAKLVVNGKAVVTDTVKKNGHVFAPLKDAAKALNVKYAVNSKKVVTLGGKKLTTTAETASFVKNGTTYVALDAVAQLLGKPFGWDAKALTFTITTK